MSSKWVKALAGPVLLVMLSVSWNVAAVAQEDQQETPAETSPETFPEPEPEPTVERDIEDTDDEFRVAVIGLIGVAVVTFVLIILYWRHTGRAARRRFEATYGPEYEDDYYDYGETDDVGFYESPPGWR